MANLADDDLLLVQRTSAGISTNYSITGSALKEDLTGVTGLIANPVEVLTPLDGSGLSGDISYYPETSSVTTVDVLTAGGSATAAAQNYWTTIAYGEGKFVALSTDGNQRGMYSSDGINWQPTTYLQSQSVYWYCSAYGSGINNGMFVALGTALNNSTIRAAYSLDGIEWNMRPVPDPNGLNIWESVAYGEPGGNPIFVAVSQDGTYRGMYSTDGVNWNSTTMPSGNNKYSSICYANGKFVAVATSGSYQAAYSTDGINWSAGTIETTPDTSQWQSVTYGNGRFVAIANTGTYRTMYSDDGINWTISGDASDMSKNWKDITYDDNKFVAVQISGGDQIAYSSNGIDWTTTISPESNPWQSVTYGGDKFVAVASNGTNRVMYSYDGITWEGDFTKLTLTNDKVFDSSNGTEMSTVDQVLTAGMVVEGESDTTVLTPAFSTTLYAGNGVMDRPVTTGIDNTVDSLIWVKNRTQAGFQHILTGQHLLNGSFTNSDGWTITNIVSNSDAQGGFEGNYITSVLDNGFTVGNSGHVNDPGQNYVAWNFRVAPEFLDIVTYSGDGSSNQEFSHSLGSMPGMVMLKNLTRASSWFVWVDDNISTLEGTLDTSGDFGSDVIGTVTDTTVQTMHSNQTASNRNGDDYVAYIFAKDTPGLIKCGSFTGQGYGSEVSGSNTQLVNTGFAPGFVMIKSKSTGSWQMFDTVRGVNNYFQSTNVPTLWANSWSEEGTSSHISFVSNGFHPTDSQFAAPGQEFVYIAIAENGVAQAPTPTGTLTADANPSDPSITLTDVTGTWSSGTTAVGRTQLTEYAPGPDDITFTSTNAGTTPFNGTDATLAFRRWTLESRSSAGDPWTVVDTYEDYDITASQDGATPWSSNKPTLSPNTMYRVKVAYISTNADPVESVYNTFTTGSN